MPNSRSTHSGPKRWIWLTVALLAVMAILLSYSVRLAGNRLSQQLAARQISLQYDHLLWSVTGPCIVGVDITSPRLKQPLHLDRLVLHPDWSSLLSGKLQGRLEGEAGPLSFSMHVASHAQRINLQNIALHTDLAWFLRQLDIRVPVNLRGGLNVSGNLELDAETGRPPQGSLTATSNQLHTILGDAAIQVGDYRLELAGSDYRWLWQLAGGQLFAAKGSGQVIAEPGPPGNWPLTGKLHLAGSGPHGADYAISGTLAAPRMQPAGA